VAKQNSFDVVARVDRQEVDNALNQARKELATRYDFKGTGAGIEWSGDAVVVSANTDERAEAALGVFKDKLAKRKVSLKGLDAGEPQPAAGGTARITCTLVSGIGGDQAKAMVAQIKRSKLAVTPTMQGEQVRISSKSKDALQEAQALLRANDQGLPLEFTNYQ